MIIDVRFGVDVPVTGVQFADVKSRDSISHAYMIQEFEHADYAVIICDEEYDGGREGYVVISSAEHAQSLITALEKATKLGWLK